MKKYETPEIERISYDVKDCLTESEKRNGAYNLEVQYAEDWDNDII